MPPKTKKKGETKKEIVDDVEDEDEAEEDIEFDADEDEFFDESKFKEFNTNIKFHVFDPDKYENEIRREIIIVPSESRKTSEIITKFEFTEVTSIRGQQIEKGSKIFADVGDETDPIKMAQIEVRTKRCPLSIMRYISSNIAEIWEVNEMIIPY